MIEGSCLCGGVGYEITGEIHHMHYCHCSMCRKAHGTAFATYTGVHPRDLRFTRGEELITRFQSSDEAQRRFCSRCGSNLLFEPKATPDVAWVAVGGFDSDPKERPGAHIYVASKAPWFEISDELLQFSEDDDDSW
jgi:hypothetical protein